MFFFFMSRLLFSKFTASMDNSFFLITKHLKRLRQNRIVKKMLILVAKLNKRRIK